MVWRFIKPTLKAPGPGYRPMPCNRTDDALYGDMMREAAKRGLAWQYAQYVARTQHLWPEWSVLEEMKRKDK
jgi:hypothetical protein